MAGPVIPKNLNTQAAKSNTYDAIVIGSGISGGWAAKELCENGLKTLVLERGRNVEHIKDYPTANLHPWEIPHRGALTHEIAAANPIARKCYAFREETAHFFVKDDEHPYIQKKPFDWIRGYQVGGKSLMWARMTQRWSNHDFQANAKDGHGVDWPIRYDDIAPWYSHVERFVGISGNRDGLPQLPDGEFLPPFEMNCVEEHFKQRLADSFPGRHLIASRVANLTQQHLGRGPCLRRDLCYRGCPYGGYFSSNSATLPAAATTGNMTLRPHSVVQSIIYDEEFGRATGVRVIDAETKETTEYHARIIFLNASTVNSTLILLNSTSNRFPNGLGNDHGILGHYLMAHNYRGRARATAEGFDDKYYFGRRPSSTYLARFRNFDDDRHDGFLRGYSYSFYSRRDRRSAGEGDEPIGPGLKKRMSEPGPWYVGLGGMGECLPAYENKMTLSKDQTDDWGMPLVEFDCEWGENELRMTEDIIAEAAAMLDAAGFKNIQTEDTGQAMGLDIHEMGTARMGRDPETSMLNAFNQIHSVPNVFVTDGSCMASTACQNPSITYMALTARAADHAVEELKKRNL
jgi:choline dehydrogenase-like flavoprotein